MKIRLLFALVGLAISPTLPAIAQEKEEANSFFYRAILATPQIAQQLEPTNRQYEEAWNKHDAVAVAALFTANATLVAPLGTFSGRDGIEKYFTDVFHRFNPSDLLTKLSYVYAFGDDLCAIGGWTDKHVRPPDPRRGLSDTCVYPCARHLEDSCGSG